MNFPLPNQWKTPPCKSSGLTQSKIILTSDEVHVWRVRLDGMDGDDNRLWQLLSDEERNRANRFHFDQHRYRFLRSHAILREVLAGYLGRPPQDLLFVADRLGKPYLDDPTDCSLHFNLSHSGDLMVIGVTFDREIGVDVEILSPNLDWKQIAEPYFHPNELEFIEGLVGDGIRLAHFYRIWVMKEAYLKAKGKGISGGLEQIEVDNNEWESPAFARFPEGDDEKNRWQVFSFEPATGACGTVVVENRPEPVSRISLWNGSKNFKFNTDPASAQGDVCTDEDGPRKKKGSPCKSSGRREED